MINKRKKNSRQRGSFTHGWGSKKKHRGAGHRGGRGNAGSGKRGDAKKPSNWKNPRAFGKFGFKKKGVVTPVLAINAGYLSDHIEKFVDEKLAKKEGDGFSIDLDSLGYTKLLGNGLVTKKLNIVVQEATEGAIAKVQAGGGVVKISGDAREVAAEEVASEEVAVESRE